MVIISPLLALLYVLLGTLFISRFVKRRIEVMVNFFAHFKMPSTQFSLKKQFSFLPKALRWH
jgi:hypothetical protein